MSIAVTRRTAPRVVIDRPATAKISISKRTSSGIVVDQNTIETSADIIIRRGDSDIRKIEDIKNVNANDLEDGYALLYDTTTQKWVSSPNEPDKLDGGYY